MDQHKERIFWNFSDFFYFFYQKASFSPRLSNAPPWSNFFHMQENKVGTTTLCSLSQRTILQHLEILFMRMILGKCIFHYYSSIQKILYLKGKMSFWTFDLEEPEYPDHDNYFLTECNQLLFEFDDDFESDINDC